MKEAEMVSSFFLFKKIEISFGCWKKWQNEMFFPTKYWETEGLKAVEKYTSLLWINSR